MVQKRRFRDPGERMSDLYEADVLLWSERQSALLRRRATGALVNDAELDWSHIAEEIEDVGRSELRFCQSLLRQALRHMLKAEAWPLSRDAPNWRADAVDFRREAKDAFTPSMRVAAFDFRRQIAFVKFIGTHAEYDRIDALTASQF